jgi:F-type H+-transporting ATPase subunit b
MEINATLIGQLITFLVLVGFTMKYVWPPITTAMRTREKKIAGGLEAAERSKRELELAEHKAIAIIRDAKHEAALIVDNAHKRSMQLVDEAKENARDEGKRIIEAANEEILREVSKTVAGASKIIRRQLDETTQSDLLDEFVAEI